MLPLLALAKEDAAGFKAQFNPLMSRDKPATPPRICERLGVAAPKSESPHDPAEDKAPADIVPAFFGLTPAEGPARITMSLPTLEPAQTTLAVSEPVVSGQSSDDQPVDAPSAAPPEAASSKREWLAFSARLVDSQQAETPGLPPPEAPGLAAPKAERISDPGLKPDTSVSPHPALTDSGQGQTGTGEKEGEKLEIPPALLAPVPPRSAVFEISSQPPQVALPKTVEPHLVEPHLVDAPPQSVTAPNSFSVRLTHPNSDSIHLKVTGISNDLQVAVHTSNPVLNETLRAGLPELKSQMHANNIQADFWKPAIHEATASSRPSNHDRPQSENRSSDSQSHRRDRDRHGEERRRDQSRQWANAYDRITKEP